MHTLFFSFLFFFIIFSSLLFFLSVHSCRFFFSLFCCCGRCVREACTVPVAGCHCACTFALAVITGRRACSAIDFARSVLSGWGGERMDVEKWRRTLQGFVSSSALQVRPAPLQKLLQSARLEVNHPPLPMEDWMKLYQNMESRFSTMQAGLSLQTQRLHSEWSGLQEPAPGTAVDDHADNAATVLAASIERLRGVLLNACSSLPGNAMESNADGSA
ncbi:hypothetical protein ECC02_010072 [Trypanosoma cruzi]|uniref:Uncharacterized protein n=1 Tax=Trypanosoma cruzi TaxID=5693 RepID=A0A7J6XSG8_TRYCR|nr:hypothetical protein ECC02_010072 [Trypanosoma cruzi]